MLRTKRDYERLTAWLHAGLAAASLFACLPAAWGGEVPWWLSLALSGVTNALIAWAKLDLLRSPDGDR